ncbi:hypothetical protein GCM10009733_059630 [Nonomuraea maheshkhaliensis]|uniref:DUF3592 domain-containing protein n=1 Tax=Nonomuraea maheshkhaliensis TaxID=419590 RepID=A0ABN2FMW8_9ACTN
MNKSTNPVMLRLRLYRPDGNPLRRPSDRLESVLVLATLTLVLLSVWPAVLGGRLVFETAWQDEHARSGTRYQVTATLLQDAPPSRVSFTEIPSERPVTAARWATSTGTERIAQVPVPPAAKAGSPVTVWLDASGAPAPPPTDPAVPRMRGMAAGLLIMLAAAFLALVSFVVWRRWMDRVRYREWELAWERTDEQWRHRHRP